MPVACPIVAFELLVRREAVLVPVVLLGNAEIRKRPVPHLRECHAGEDSSPVGRCNVPGSTQCGDRRTLDTKASPTYACCHVRIEAGWWVRGAPRELRKERVSPYGSANSVWPSRIRGAPCSTPILQSCDEATDSSARPVSTPS